MFCIYNFLSHMILAGSLLAACLGYGKLIVWSVTVCVLNRRCFNYEPFRALTRVSSGRERELWIASWEGGGMALEVDPCNTEQSVRRFWFVRIISGLERLIWSAGVAELRRLGCLRRASRRSTCHCRNATFYWTPFCRLDHVVYEVPRL